MKRKTILAAAAIAAVLLVAMLLGGVEADGTKGSETPDSPLSKTTLAYKAIEGVNPDLLSLDIYHKRGIQNAPVLLFFHGGGLTTGDKADPPTAEMKSSAFVDAGYVFVSANYRLLPDAKYPDHIVDVADAVAYVLDHVQEYGGDPGRLMLMGHSSGAHMVSLVSTNEKYLAQAGKAPSDIQAVVSLDTEQYDITPAYAKLTHIDEAYIRDAGAIHFVEANKGIPPFLTFYNRARRSRMQYQQPFIDRLTQCGIPAEAVWAKNDAHEDVDADIGTPGDQKTEIILAFLKAPDRVHEIATQYHHEAL